MSCKSILCYNVVEVEAKQGMKVVAAIQHAVQTFFLLKNL